MNRYFVGVDLGATSGRVILATLCGDGIALEVLHRFPNRLLSIGGKYYWNIYSLYEEILHGLTLAGQRRLRVDSIGIDTWGVDMACVAADGTLAGSTAVMNQVVLNFLINSGASLPDVVAMASANPAKDLGLYDRLGSLEEGKQADVVVLDSNDFHVKQTVIAGELVYDELAK